VVYSPTPRGALPRLPSWEGLGVGFFLAPLLGGAGGGLKQSRIANPRQRGLYLITPQPPKGGFKRNPDLKSPLGDLGVKKTEENLIKISISL